MVMGTVTKMNLVLTKSSMKSVTTYTCSLELSCYYWCWCSALGDLIIPADCLSISLGIGLSITFKAGVELLRWLWGTVAQWSEHLQLKQEALGLIPSSYPGFFSLPVGLY